MHNNVYDNVVVIIKLLSLVSLPDSVDKNHVPPVIRTSRVVVTFLRCNIALAIKSQGDAFQVREVDIRE